MRFNLNPTVAVSGLNSAVQSGKRHFSDFLKLDSANATVLGRSLILEHAFISLSVKTQTDLRNVCILRQFGFRKKNYVFQPTCLQQRFRKSWLSIKAGLQNTRAIRKDCSMF